MNGVTKMMDQLERIFYFCEVELHSAANRNGYLMKKSIIESR